MIKIEKTDYGFRTYSDEGYMIRPILDRLGKPIRETTKYDEAEDIEVDGHPRYDYEETEIPIEPMPEAIEPLPEEEEEVEP